MSESASRCIVCGTDTNAGPRAQYSFPAPQLFDGVVCYDARCRRIADELDSMDGTVDWEKCDG